MHGLGVTDWLTTRVPEVAIPALEALTQLGDAWFLAALAAVGYWHGPGRILDSFDDGLRFVAATLTGLAAVSTLKALVGHPRPPADVALVATDGLSLPSGHATGSAAAFLAAALLWTVSTRRRRLAVAGFGVALVSATRLALGVHYLLDVVAGALLGAVAALAVVAIPPERTEYGLWLAAAVGALGFLGPGSTDALAVAGVAAGVGLAWVAIRERSLARPGRLRTLAGAAVVAALLGAVLSLSLAPVPVAIMSVCSGAVLGALPAQNFSR